jgi:hypothetical protein
MSLKMLMFKAGIDLILGPPPPENQFHDGIDFSHGIDSMESIPVVLESLKIWAQRLCYGKRIS